MRRVTLVIDLLLKELDPTLTYGCVLLHPLLKLHLFPVFSLGLLDLLSILGSEEFLGALLCSVNFVIFNLLQFFLTAFLMLEFATQQLFDVLFP